jgi:aspartate racemase
MSNFKPKTIGIMGGLPSVMIYQNLANEITMRRAAALGMPAYGPEILARSFDFAEIKEWRLQGKFEYISDFLMIHALDLIHGGAEIILLANNLLHKNFSGAGDTIPFVDIVDTMAEEVRKTGVKTLGLIGNNESFYKERVASMSGIEIITPKADDLDKIGSIIASGRIKDERDYLRQVCNNLVNDNHVEAVALGCTQMGAVLKANFDPVADFGHTSDSQYKNTMLRTIGSNGIPRIAYWLDSAELHVRKAVELSFSYFTH